MRYNPKFWHTLLYLTLAIGVPLLLAVLQYYQLQSGSEHYLPFGICHL